MVNHAVNIAKVALAKVNSVASGTTTTVDARVSPMSQSLGITYDASNNVLSNQTNINIADLLNRIATLETRLAQYENHTHSYIDDNGTTSTTKTTGIVI